eukprot:325593-Chlamydomonas_euryale.AAC.6
MVGVPVQALAYSRTPSRARSIDTRRTWKHGAHRGRSQWPGQERLGAAWARVSTAGHGGRRRG